MALVAVAVVMVSVLGGVTLLTHVYSLNGIKNKTVGQRTAWYCPLGNQKGNP